MSHEEMLVQLGCVVLHERPVKAAVQVGDVVQLPPTHVWALSTWIVSEVKGFGVVAYANIPGQGLCFLRLRTGQFEVVGPAAWTAVK